MAVVLVVVAIVVVFVVAEVVVVVVGIFGIVGIADAGAAAVGSSKARMLQGWNFRVLPIGHATWTWNKVRGGDLTRLGPESRRICCCIFELARTVL